MSSVGQVKVEGVRPGLNAEMLALYVAQLLLQQGGQRER